LRNPGKETAKGITSAYFEPVLQAAEDYAAHPAFSKLFLDARIKDGACLIRRRPRAGNKERWLAFICDGDGVSYETMREKVVGRGSLPREQTVGAATCRPETDGREIPAPTKQNLPSSLPPPLDPCVYASIPVSLAPGEKTVLRFALAAAATAADAVSAAKRTLKRAVGSGVPDEAAQYTVPPLGPAGSASRRWARKGCGRRAFRGTCPCC
jgi:cyclic beta-1,2-glucan synthetase